MDVTKSWFQDLEQVQSMQRIKDGLATEQDGSAQQLCMCPPLTPLHTGGMASYRREAFLPVAPELNRELRSTLEEQFPRSTPFSLFQLHIAQFKPVQVCSISQVVKQRRSYHAPLSLRDQILHAIRRTLRRSDQILIDAQGIGAALLFPSVDQDGIVSIAGRISRSINLLQAETIVPPLEHETEILLSFASYPQAAHSLEQLLLQAGQPQGHISFRPAVIPGDKHTPARMGHTGYTASARSARVRETRLREARANGIPFMQLPSRLPARLKRLVPYALALKLRCAPVGRNHNQLTVAMANPLDTQALCRLREVTGMSIFPVSCEIAALDMLLAHDW
jgi:hypothetical protein